MMQIKIACAFVIKFSIVLSCWLYYYSWYLPLQPGFQSYYSCEADKQHFPEISLISSHICLSFSYCHIFKQKITPIVLNIEEEPKDKHDVHQADKDDHHHATVYRHPDCSLLLHAPIPVSPTPVTDKLNLQNCQDPNLTVQYSFVTKHWTTCMSHWSHKEHFR